jgi:hypothetical protein
MGAVTSKRILGDYKKNYRISLCLLLTFLKERDVAVIGCDGVSDVYPSGIEGKKEALRDLV